MNYLEVRKLMLRTFLCFLGLTALVAIISVLGGSFGELEEKIIGTTFTISAASICAMSCAAFIEKKRLPVLGLTGIGLAILTAILVITVIWAEIDNKLYGKITVSTAVSTIACALAFLLGLPELGRRQRWFQPVTYVSIVILAVQIIYTIWIEIEEGDYFFRALAAVGIIVGLETVSLPILVKLQKVGGGRKGQLMLKHLEEDIYTDSAGCTYRVHKLDEKNNM